MKLTKIQPATKDSRGVISDILFDKQINHVAVIETKANNIRGNHYHKLSTQWIYVMSGSLYYWYTPKIEITAGFVKVSAGEMVETPANEIHCLDIREDTKFIVFATGPRGGTNYEEDTYHIDPPILRYCDWDYSIPSPNAPKIITQKKVLIFGKDGGIGSATEKLFTSKGHEVWGLNRFLLDLAKARDVEIEAVIRGFNPDILVYAAGAIKKSFEETIQVNFGVPWMIVRYYLRRFEYSPEKLGTEWSPAKLIFIGSSCYNQASPRHVIYGASKAALNSMVESVNAKDEHHSGLPKISIINPGPTRTKMRLAATGRFDEPNILEPETVAQLIFEAATA